MKINVCFKIPGEDLTLECNTVMELAKELQGYDRSCIAGIYINGRKLHIVPGGAT